MSDNNNTIMALKTFEVVQVFWDSTDILEKDKSWYAIIVVYRLNYVAIVFIRIRECWLE